MPLRSNGFGHYDVQQNCVNVGRHMRHRLCGLNRPGTFGSLMILCSVGKCPGYGLSPLCFTRFTAALAATELTSVSFLLPQGRPGAVIYSYLTGWVWVG